MAKNEMYIAVLKFLSERTGNFTTCISILHSYIRVRKVSRDPKSCSLKSVKPDINFKINFLKVDKFD